MVLFKTYILGLISAELEPDDLLNNQLELLSQDILSSGSNSADINPRMYVFKRTIDEVQLPNTDDLNGDAINFNWKYLMRRIPLSDEIFQFTIFQQHQSDVIIHEFLEKNVVGKINYNSDQFLIRTSFGYTSTQGVCTLGYQLNILGWNKLKMIEQDPYSEVFRTNNHQC